MNAFTRFEEDCQTHPPEVFLVLGSGLESVSREVQPISSIRFDHIPGLPPSSVPGHRGTFTLGRWRGRLVLCSEGRLHYYEGHPWEIVVLPIQIAARLGARIALLTNAAGGIRVDLEPGSLLPIEDHIEWNRPAPWKEAKQPSPYSPRLLGVIASAVAESSSGVAPGIYCSVTGPSYETPAEIRAMRAMGADAVGMSTSREILAGKQAGMECGAISLITNRAAGLTAAPLSHEEVLAMGRKGASQLGALLGRILEKL